MVYYIHVMTFYNYILNAYRVTLKMNNSSQLSSYQCMYVCIYIS